jgi:hypothetical protein
VKTIPDPPRLSTFKRKGGVQNPICTFPNSHDRGTQIDDTHTTRIILSCSVLKCAWAPLPSYHFPTTILLLTCVILLPLFYGPCSLPFLIIHISASMHLPLLHISLPLNVSITSIFPPLSLIASCHMSPL